MSLRKKSILKITGSFLDCRSFGTGRNSPFFFHLAGLQLLFFLFAAAGGFPTIVTAAAPAAVSSRHLTPVDLRELKVWNRALDHLAEGADETSASWFYHFYTVFPESEFADDALWNAAQIQKGFALKSKNPDWGKVMEYFKEYAIYYPDNDRSDRAYFEVGLSQYKLKFFREALSRFILFQRKYQESRLIPEAIYWQGKILVQIGRLDEARDLFNTMLNSPDRRIKTRANVGMAYIHFEEKKYLAALQSLKEGLAIEPAYYLEDPEVLRVMGLSNLYSGREHLGRKQLFHYLNIDVQSVFRTQILYIIAENYSKYRDQETAVKLFQEILETDQSDSREVLVSRLRIAQYNDDPTRKTPDWVEQKVDLLDTAADSDYLAVIDNYYEDAAAQEARYGLFRRYMARQDYKRGFEIGKDYLQLKGGDNRQEINTALGNILVSWVEEMLAEKKYQEIYDLYKKEYAHVSRYPQGRLLYLVGQALESLYLYDQASLVYYRSLGLPLSEEEKIDLYYRRAHVYLANHDLDAAEILLKYLRQVYKDTEFGREIYFLSGRLREQQQRFEEARDFFALAVDTLTDKKSRPRYGQKYLEILFKLDAVSAIEKALRQFYDEKWFDPTDMQGWFTAFGNLLRQKEQYDAAIAAYETAIDETMPQTRKMAQEASVHLGDLYLLQDDRDKSLFYFEKGLQGEDPFWKKLAEQRLHALELEKKMRDFGGFEEDTP